MTAGEPAGTGIYPEGTLHAAVSARLAQYTETLRALAGRAEGTGKNEVASA